MEIQKEYFNLHLKYLLWFGVDLLPFGQVHPLFKIYSWFVFIFIIWGYCIIEFLSIIFNPSDVITLTFTLCYNMTHVLGLIKVTILSSRKKYFRSMFDKLETGVFAPSMKRGGEKEFEFVNAAIRGSNNQGLCFYGIVVVIMTFRSIFAALDKGIYKETWDETSNTTHVLHIRTTPSETWLPFDTNSSPYYEILSIYQVTAIMAFGIYIGAVDAIICGYMMHMKAQLLILKLALETYLHKTELKPDNSKKTDHDKLDDLLLELPEETRLKADEIVKSCVHHHELIISFCEEIEEGFKYLLLLQFLSSVLIICFQLFQLSTSVPGSFEFISMVIYTLLMVLQVLYYCYNGNEVTVLSDKISSIAYLSSWLATNETTKKALLLLMMRSQRPIMFSAGKFSYLTLETFMAIIKGSGSYFMVLKQTNEASM